MQAIDHRNMFSLDNPNVAMAACSRREGESYFCLRSSAHASLRHSPPSVTANLERENNWLGHDLYSPIPSDNDDEALDLREALVVDFNGERSRIRGPREVSLVYGITHFYSRCLPTLVDGENRVGPDTPPSHSALSK